MQISTKGLLFDPYSPTLVEDLARYDEFRVSTGHLLHEKVFRFIIFMYDMGSEMRQMYPDWQDRKVKCAALAGWEVDRNGRFQDAVMEMLEGNNDEVNDMIVKFCLLFPSPYYSAYISMWELLAKEVRTSFATTNDSADITKIRGNIKELSKQIDEYSEKIFGGEKTIGLKNSLYKSVDKARLRLRPEIMSRDIKSGNTALPDQYYPKEKEEKEKVVAEKQPKLKLGRGRPKVYRNVYKKT
jgi:hypothetical protein